jgi:hypothetical protein
MFDISSLLPKDEYINQRKRAAQLVKKWQPTGLLEGLRGANVGNMAQLLENQARQILKEANTTSTVQGSEEWAGIVLPLVRRTYGETINAKEFVSFQPMNLPNGLVFWIDFKYGTGQPGFNTGAGKDSQNDSLWGVTDPAKGTSNPYGWQTPAEGLYGAGRFGYSMNDYSSSALAVAGTVSSTEFTTGSISATDYNFNSDFSQSLVVGGSSLIKVTVATSSLSNFDPLAVRSFTLANSVGSVINDVYQEFTKYNKSAGTIQFIVSGSGVTTSTRFVVNYTKQPTDITRGDFEVGKTQAGTGFDTALDIPQVNIEMRQDTIVAKARKLKTMWSQEFAQDLNAYHNIDTEAEITKMMSDYMGKEIDLEILDMLIAEAASTHVDYWSTRIGYEWNGSSFQPITQNLTAYIQPTWFQTLSTKLNKMSNRIHAATGLGGANFMVVSPQIATVLESIPAFAVDTDGTRDKFNAGIQKMGTISNRFEVYKSAYMRDNVILMGYRGGSFLECGAVYAPYVPLITTPTVLDYNNFQPHKGMSTRYAKKMLRPEFYGKIYVEGLNLI